jgi:tetratricopeptide (TPR) repeat protein
MAQWIAFPYDNSGFFYDDDALKALWPRLHVGDAEPWPEEPQARLAWRHFHAGEFQQALEVGLAAGGSGITAANQAQCLYAGYLEEKEALRLEMFMAVALRAGEQQAREPRNPNAYFCQAYALGRYGQTISVAKALAQGLGQRVRSALDTTLQLAPQHAYAHTALGAFHAEVIDKVGKLVAKSQGADSAAGLRHLEQAQALSPHSPGAMIERANALMMLEGKKRLKQAEALYEAAAACEPMDAKECLEVMLARCALES